MSEATRTQLSDCSIVQLPRVNNLAGNLTAINGMKDVPFDIRRVYYLYDIPGGVERGGHAHKALYQLIVAASGSFDVVIDDGNKKEVISLNRPYHGLLLVPGIWRELENFSSGSICLVLASSKYDEKDYIREYEGFVKFKQ